MRNRIKALIIAKGAPINYLSSLFFISELLSASESGVLLLIKRDLQTVDGEKKCFIMYTFRTTK